MSILESVKNFMDHKLSSVEYEVVDEMVFTGRYGQRLHFCLQDSGKIYNFQYVIDEESRLMMVLCFFPDKFKKEFLNYVYPFINQINYNQIIDTAVIDPEDGELSFRIGYDFRGIEVNPAIPEYALATLIKTTKAYSAHLDQLLKAIGKACQE